MCVLNGMLSNTKISTKLRKTHFLPLPLASSVSGFATILSNQFFSPLLLRNRNVTSGNRVRLCSACSPNRDTSEGVTFTHADGAALLVLAVAVAAVLVAGEGRTLDAATHLAAMFVPPEG